MPRRSQQPHRRVARMGRRHLTVALAAGLAVSLSLLLAAPATSVTPQQALAAKQAQAKRLQSQIQANYDRADQLDEQLVQAQTAVADAQAKIGAQVSRGCHAHMDFFAAQTNSAR